MNDKPECSIQKLISIVKRLRGPDGCPWDQAQTTASLRPYLLEECHEYLCTLEQSNSEETRDELGDLLLQIVLHAQIFAEQQIFSLNDVAESICNKLIRRHPHVFARETVSATTDLDLQWETIKQSEKAGTGNTPVLFETIDPDLPPLQFSRKLSEKASRIGLDWPDANAVLCKVREEVNELEEAMQNESVDAITHELGDLLFATVNLARHLDIDAELALRQSNLRFTRRVQRIDTILNNQGLTFNDLNSKELDQQWEEAKRAEKNGKGT